MLPHVPENKDITAKLVRVNVFDVCYLIALGLFLVGMVLDSWAHTNVPQLETFWTPWHAILYSGVFATAFTLWGVAIVNRRRGASWSEALPQGYSLALWGSMLFPAVGAGDALWHTLFGIERNLDAVFSPTHLAGMVAGWMLVTGPYQAIVQRQVSTSERSIRFFLAVALPFLYLEIITQTSNYLLWRYPQTALTGQNALQKLAVLMFVLQALILTGWMLYIMRKSALSRLPVGLFTVMLTLASVVLSLMAQSYILIGMGALSGAVIDAANVLLQPSQQRLFAFRLFAMVVAAGPCAVYLVLLAFTGGLVWSIHLTLGSIFVVGMLGFLLTYLTHPANTLQLPPSEGERAVSTHSPDSDKCIVPGGKQQGLSEAHHQRVAQQDELLSNEGV